MLITYQDWTVRYTLIRNTAAPHVTMIIVHLEDINHCLETRADYHERLPTLGVDMNRIRIPYDGETVDLNH